MVETLSVAPKTRQIRVFLSSTFRDFMEERDLLVKQVFPALRRRAQERGVDDFVAAWHKVMTLDRFDLG